MTTMDVLDQHSIVDCDSVIKKHNFTRLDLLLDTVFLHKLERELPGLKFIWLMCY